MKKLLLNLSMLLSLGAFAQETTAPLKIVKDHYSVSGGLLGAVDFTKFRVSGNNTGNISFKSKTGWSAGIWINFPFGKAVSFEPQFMYSSYKYNSSVTNGTIFEGNIEYISLPLLFKFHLGSALALTVGPQFDFRASVSDNHNNSTKSDFKSTSTSISGGLELFPHGRVTIFGRYIHGLTNIDASGNPNTVVKYYNQVIQTGLKFKLFGKHIPADSDGDGISDPLDKCTTVVGFQRYQGCPIPDSDGDAINDEVDKCPAVAGLAKYGGCPIPDTDGDGVNDEEDKCPAVAGLAKYQGCPIPDTDGDGINDEQDKCPNQAGVARYQGCPIPDTDRDGVIDEEDKCPTTPGDPTFGGCPKIENFQAHEVTFASGKAVLTAGGKAELDLAVNYMTKYPEVKVLLVGYTDNSGTDKINIPLSEKRSAAAKAYLVSKGIDESRLATAGHGSADPVEENKTKAGKAKNRRVEAKLQ